MFNHVLIVFFNLFNFLSLVHIFCLFYASGLGRAPVLVAIGMIETGMRPLDVIEYIRARRKHAINHKQMGFLEKYRPRASVPTSCCLIS